MVEIDKWFKCYTWLNKWFENATCSAYTVSLKLPWNPMVFKYWEGQIMSNQRGSITIDLPFRTYKMQM